jgi:hypothetical protein
LRGIVPFQVQLTAWRRVDADSMRTAAAHTSAPRAILGSSQRGISHGIHEDLEHHMTSFLLQAAFQDLAVL